MSSIRAAFGNVLALAVIAIGAAASWYLYMLVRDAMHAELYAYADQVASLATPADLAALSGTYEDTLDPEYARLKESLVAWRAASETVSFGYFLGENTRSEVFFYIDSEDPASPDYSPPGQIYYEASTSLKESFLTGERTIEGPVTDRWGRWLSAFVPVTDASGRVIAVAGIDTRAEGYLLRAAIAVAGPIVLALFIVLFLAHRSRKKRQVA